MNKYYIYLDGKEVDTVCRSDDEELQEYIDNGGNCENYHCDHYLKLEPKED